MAEPYHRGLLSDEPAERDRLEFDRFVRAVDGLVLKPEQVETPLTVGIYGSWGSGKSSLLKQIKAQLEDDDRKDRFLPVEFSPWEYQHEPNLLVPLLLTLTEGRRSQALKKEVGKIVRVVLRTAAYVAVRGKVAQEAGEKEEQLDAQKHGKLDLAEITKLRKSVEKVVALVRGRKKRTLVILIDDLDRCHPPNRIVELLEQIKVFLTVEGCVFILACDREVVAQAIDAQFPGQGASYLEKFVQIPFHLPRPQSPQIVDLIPGFVAGAAEAENGTSETQARRNEWLAYLEHLAAALGNNPRRFKRFYNSFVLARETLREADAPPSDRAEQGRASALSDRSEGLDRDYLLAKWILLRDTSPALAESPSRVLELEAQLPVQGRVGMEEIEKEFGLTRGVLLFLQGDASRKFGSIQRLSFYSRLTNRDLDITREDIEERILTGQPLPRDLSGLDLSRANLPGADFSECELTGTVFAYANIDAAVFDRANVEGADFTGARFQSVSLKGVLNLDKIEADEATFERLDNERIRQTSEQARADGRHGE